MHWFYNLTWNKKCVRKLTEDKEKLLEQQNEKMGKLTPLLLCTYLKLGHFSCKYWHIRQLKNKLTWHLKSVSKNQIFGTQKSVVLTFIPKGYNGIGKRAPPKNNMSFVPILSECPECLRNQNSVKTMVDQGCHAWQRRWIWIVNRVCIFLLVSSPLSHSLTDPLTESIS